MNIDRIKEIQQQTAYPESVSVQQALLKVWNETVQEQLHIASVSLPDSDEIRMKARELDEKDFDQWWWETVYMGNVL